MRARRNGVINCFMNLRSPFLMMTTCAFLAACQTTGPTAPNTATVAKLSSLKHAGKGTVMIYRPQNYLGGMLSPTVQLDGKSLVDMDNGRVFIGAIPPGHHVFEIENQESGTEVTLRPGDAIYLKVEIVPGVWKGNGKLTQVAPEQGEFEAKRLELINPSQIDNPAFR